MIQDKATVLRHDNFQGEYRILHLETKDIGPLVKPGQFVHLQIPGLKDRILRRPFSIYKADNASISILYKPVGRGTESMIELYENEEEESTKRAIASSMETGLRYRMFNSWFNQRKKESSYSRSGSIGLVNE